MDHEDPVLNPRFLRERLAEHLRQGREHAGFHQGAAATKLRWSESKLQRIETGIVGISPTDTKALLELYGIRDQETVSRLMTLAQEARRRDRFTPFRKFLSPEYQTLLSYEQSAADVVVVNAFLIPGLLQTPEYARALLSVKHSGDKLEGLVKARAARQQILDQPDGPRFVFVVEEGALRRHVGGSQVMFKQLVHLRRMADRSNLRLHITPFTARAHLGLWELYVIMTIPASTLTGEAEQTIIYREAGNSEFLVRDDQVRIKEYKASFDALLDESLGQSKTRDLLDDLIDEMARSAATSTPLP